METFDEWHLRRHGTSFDDLYMANGMLFIDAMRALARLMRDYASEMMAALGSGAR